MLVMQTDVLIVGAGPTGLALACQMIRYGIDFVIVDKNETTTPHSKAIGVQARTLEIYEQMDLADKIVAEGTIANAARMIVDGKVRGEISFRDVGKGMSSFPFFLIVEQGVHERILYDFIKSHGKDVRWQTSVESFTQDAERVTASIKNAKGEIENIEVKYLVGCDGAKSLTRHTLGLEFSGGTFERLFYVADVQIDWDFDHGAFYVCLAKTNVTAFFPMRGGAENKYRIVGTFPEGHDRDEGEILYEEVERQIVKDTGLGLDISDVNWFSVYKVHSRYVNKFSNNRCFLAGDSAHIHTPAGAQGMNTGIQDGYNLAWKLAFALRGASPAILETYNEERLPNAKRLIQTTDRFFLLGASKNWLAGFVRTRIAPYIANFVFGLSFMRRRLFPLVSQIGINYRQSSLSEFSGYFTVKAGDRMPWFEVDSISVYNRLQAPKFHLIVFTDESPGIQMLAYDLVQNCNSWTDSHVFELDDKLSKIFGTRSAFFVILRPDNYIGLISSEFSVQSVRDYLSRYTDIPH